MTKIMRVVNSERIYPRSQKYPDSDFSKCKFE
jgi:hypothetical protein